MKRFLLSIAVFLFAVSAGQAAEGVIQKPNVEMQLAGFPASGKKFPNNASGPPPTQEVWYDCSTGFTKSPCTTLTTLTQTAHTGITTFVIKFNPAAITQPTGASTITLALYTPVTTQQILNSVWAGGPATSGAGNCSASFCAWDFAAATKTQLFFPVSGTDCSSTQANHTFPPGSRSVFSTCQTTFSWPSTGLTIAFDAATGTTVTITESITANTMVIPKPASFTTSMYSCWKSGTSINQASVQSKNSGYTFCDAGAVIAGRIAFVQSITAQ